MLGTPEYNATVVFSIVWVPNGRHGFAFVGFSPGNWRLIDKDDAQTIVPKIKRVSALCPSYLVLLARTGSLLLCCSAKY